ncbi:Na+/H+ antiporter subunit E [Opitutales bacterium]|nr:Na+/H+ antiporter subunit E [Opitutales bacterium]
MGKFFSFGVAPNEKCLFLCNLIFLFTLYLLVVFILLFLNWIVLSGKFDAFHLGLGVVSCVVVTWLSQDLLFYDRKMGFVERTRQVFAFLRYIPWIIWEVVKANLHVLKLATTSKGYEEISPRVVTFKTILKTDFAKFVLANSITLTPGTITMLIRGKVFHVHTMSQFLEDDLLTGSIEKKVAEVFEPDVLP